MNCEVERMACNKPALNIEFVESDPLQAIANIFESSDFDCLRANLCRWFHAAIVNGNHVYEDDMQRKGLQSFFTELELLLEAIYLIYRNDLFTASDGVDLIAVNTRLTCLDKVYLLSGDQTRNPHAVIKFFFDRFSIVYIRRELQDWLQAGIDVESCDQIKLNPNKVLLTHNDLECLLEAAYHYNYNVLTESKWLVITCCKG
jgi:hypothetical protein